MIWGFLFLFAWVLATSFGILFLLKLDENGEFKKEWNIFWTRVASEFKRIFFNKQP